MSGAGLRMGLERPELQADAWGHDPAREDADARVVALKARLEAARRKREEMTARKKQAGK